MHKSKYILQAVTRSLFGLLLVLAFVLVFHSQAPVFGNNGAVWTTRADCGTEQQDVNHYSVGESVYINASGLDANILYQWKIIGKSGGASSDPNQTVASGTKMTDGSGSFCLSAYTVMDDDEGEYGIDVYIEGGAGQKQDNYRVDCKSSCPTPTSCISPSPTATPIPPTPTDRIEDPDPYARGNSRSYAYF